MNILKLIVMAGVCCFISNRGIAAPGKTLATERFRNYALNIVVADQLNHAPLKPELQKILLSALRDEADKKYFKAQFAKWRPTKGTQFVGYSDRIRMFKAGQFVAMFEGHWTKNTPLKVNGQVFSWNLARPLKTDIERFLKSAVGQQNKSADSAIHKWIEIVESVASARLSNSSDDLRMAIAVTAIADQAVAEDTGLMAADIIEQYSEINTNFFNEPGLQLWGPTVQCDLKNQAASGKVYFGDPQTEFEFRALAEGPQTLVRKSTKGNTTYQLMPKMIDERDDCLMRALYCHVEAGAEGCLRALSAEKQCDGSLAMFEIRQCINSACNPRKPIPPVDFISGVDKEMERLHENVEQQARALMKEREGVSGVGGDLAKITSCTPNRDGVSNCVNSAAWQDQAPTQRELGTAYAAKRAAFYNYAPAKIFAIAELNNSLALLPDCCADETGECPAFLKDKFGVTLSGAFSATGSAPTGQKKPAVDKAPGR